MAKLAVLSFPFRFIYKTERNQIRRPLLRKFDDINVFCKSFMKTRQQKRFRLSEIQYSENFAKTLSCSTRHGSVLCTIAGVQTFA